MAKINNKQYKVKNQRKNTSKKSNTYAQSRRSLLKYGLPILSILVIAGIGAKFVFFSQASAFEYLGTHPQASQQGTPLGQHIHVLKAWNGKIYSGYGDYDKNTGPIAMTPFDPVTKTFSSTPEFIADTEQVDNFDEFDGNLYVPSIDPRASADYSVATAQTGSPLATWKGTTPVGMTHTYDMAKTGNTLWMAGSKGNDAVVYRSDDGGTTWVQSLAVGPSAGKAFARFYMIGSLQGKMYVQAIEADSSYRASIQPKSKVFDGSRWADGPSLAGTSFYYRPSEFAGKMVFQTNTNSGSLAVFDGRSTSYPQGATAYTITPDGTLYVMNSKEILKTKDLVTWQKVGIAPEMSKSIEVLNGYIYIGTYDSKLYRASINLLASDSQAPAISITSPANGSMVSGTVKITSSLQDNVGVEKITYTANNYAVYGTTTTDSNGNKTLEWNTTYYNNGTYVLNATAYDSSGNSTAAQPITITINNPVAADTTAPYLNVSAPTDGTKLKGRATINANASDNKGVARIEALVDGTVVTVVQNTTNLSYKINTRDLAPGPHIISVIAYDFAGNKTEKTVNVTK